MKKLDLRVQLLSATGENISEFKQQSVVIVR
jgi:hypothetical protein